MGVGLIEQMDILPRLQSADDTREDDWGGKRLAMYRLHPPIGGLFMMFLMEYKCYSEACSTIKECCECGQERVFYGKKYDASDYDYGLQERFVLFGECCECGSTEVEK